MHNNYITYFFWFTVYEKIQNIVSGTKKKSKKYYKNNTYNSSQVSLQSYHAFDQLFKIELSAWLYAHFYKMSN